MPRRGRYARQRRWSEALSPWTLVGRRRRRPVGIRMAGMSSNSASNLVASLALAALRTTDSGSPPRSPARCSLEPCLPRSTGVAPVRSPVDRPQAEGVDTDAFQVDPAGGTEFVQQDRPELLEHPGAGPLVQASPAGGGRAAAQFLGWQQAPRGRGAGHEDERGDAVAVRHTARDAAARAGRRWRQQRLDALPQLRGEESVDKGGHTGASPPGSTDANPPPGQSRIVR
jgi:hypothetical protein